MLVTFFHCQVAYEGFIPEKQQPRLSTDQEFGCYSYCVFLYHCEAVCGDDIFLHGIYSSCTSNGIQFAILPFLSSAIRILSFL